jgi:hypothetical protein
MNLSETDNGALALDDIPPFLSGLLQAIPVRAASDEPGVESRFFPSPGGDEHLAEDWQAFIRPDLQETFRSAREVVAGDLVQLSQAGEPSAMRIPRAHMEAWLNALNQARLSIAEEHHFGDADLSREVTPDPSDPRSLALFQINFYGFLQECLMRMLE